MSPNPIAHKPPSLSPEALSVSPFMVMEVLERARELEREGKVIIHMEVGEPDFPTPDPIVMAMDEIMRSGAFRYAHSLGDPDLREELSRHFKKMYGVTVKPERFLITPGSSVGLTLLFGALLQRGDRVLLSDPYYSCYPNFVRFFGGETVCVRLREKDGFKADPEELDRAIDKFRNVKALLINSPANPTGAVLDPERLSGIARLSPLIISDEIYHGLNYGPERDHSILEYTDNAVVVGGFSKSFAMTGWRVGYLVLPEEYVRPMRTLSQNFVISVNSAVQKAAIAALQKAWPEVERMRYIYNQRRLLLLKGLSSLGLGVLSEPEGAFYILAKVSHVNPDSKALVFDLLEKAGVATTPGAEFGEGAEGFLRFSYAVSSENIQEALRRLKDYLAKRGFLPIGREE